MRNRSASNIAFGGVMAALAIVIMCMGGLIPATGYLCPMMCILVLEIVRRRCADRIAWAWYGAVALLSILIGPDKEAAGMFTVLGYYPIVKPKLERLPFKWLWKLLLFNVSVLLLYGFLIHVLGMAELLEESQELGVWMTAIMLILGNVIFILLDFVLSRFGKRRKNGR